MFSYESSVTGLRKEEDGEPALLILRGRVYIRIYIRNYQKLFHPTEKCDL